MFLSMAFSLVPIPSPHWRRFNESSRYADTRRCTMCGNSIHIKSHSSTRKCTNVSEQETHSWLVALDGIEYDVNNAEYNRDCSQYTTVDSIEIHGNSSRNNAQQEGPEIYWHTLKYKAPWVHADEWQPRVTQKTWKRRDPVLSTISGDEQGTREQTTAMSQIAENLRRIRGPQKDVESVQSESRIGRLVKRLIPASDDPVDADEPFDELSEESEDFNLSKEWIPPDSFVPEPEKPVKSIPKFPWEMEDSPEVFREDKQQRRVKPPSLAELVIPDAELRRLRALIITTKERIKVRRLGITRAVVEAIHYKWRTSEIVKLKCSDEVAKNMRKVHEELEKRTGGLVIWRAGGALAIYRGKDYAGPPPERRYLREENKEMQKEQADNTPQPNASVNSQFKELISRTPFEKPDRSHVSGEVIGPDPQFKDFLNHNPSMDSEYFTAQMDKLLEGLGPRYTEWTGSKPVPIDADKLPFIDHSYKSPYRLLPYGLEPKLTDSEFTNLCKLAKQMPPQFVVSRNNGLQGLAKAIVKLWAKTEVTKIEIKLKAQHINNARMASELKQLTGGIILGRSTEHLLIYRGKDFLPPAIASAFEERERMSFANEHVEDKGRMLPTGRITDNIMTMPTKGEAEADAKLKEWLSNEEEQKRRLYAVKSAQTTRAKRLQRQLDIAYEKKEKAAESVRRLDSLVQHQQPPLDRETITEEERNMLQKLGLRMHAFLLLGRRGVYSGTVQNMHLHWKYRDMVKVIYKGRDRADIQETAQALENESGGILIGIVPTSKGQALLYYRGKNYTRPEDLRPHNLLTRRKALERFTENQRRESLSRYILTLEKEVKSLGFQLEKLKDDQEKSDNGKALPSVQLAKMEMKDNSLLESEQPVKRRVKLRDVDFGPIIRAEPLTNRERLILRKRALRMGKPSHFNIGKENVTEGLVRSIRMYFKKRALLKIGVKGRSEGTSVQEIMKQLEEGTGAAFVCKEKQKLIFYRGWPEGEKHPKYLEEDIPYELISAVQEEDELDFSSHRTFVHRQDAKSYEEGSDGDSDDDVSSMDDYDNLNSRHSEDSAAYTTGEETDDEVWNLVEH